MSAEIDTSNTPCPTPVAELFNTPESTPSTVVKAGSKRSLSPDNTGTAVKRMPPRSCKANSNKRVVVIEDSPEVICLDTVVKKAPGKGIKATEQGDCIVISSDSSPATPFAAESNGDTVVRRVLRSGSKINGTLEPSLVKNPSDLFKEDHEEERGRSSTRKRHKAGDSSRHGKKSKTSERRHRSRRSGSKSRERSKKGSDSSSESSQTRSRGRKEQSRHESTKKSSSKSPETARLRQKERSRKAEHDGRKGKNSQARLEKADGKGDVENTMKHDKKGNKSVKRSTNTKVTEQIDGVSTKSLLSVENNNLEGSKSIHNPMVYHLRNNTNVWRSTGVSHMGWNWLIL